MKGNIIIIALIFGTLAFFFGNIYLGLIGLLAFLYQVYKNNKERKKKKIEDISISL